MAPQIIGTPVEGTIRAYLKLNYSYRKIISILKKDNIKISKFTIGKIHKYIHLPNVPITPRAQRQQPLRVLTNKKLNNLKKMATSPNPAPQRFMAKKLGVSQSTINQHIHGRLNLVTRKKPNVHQLSARNKLLRHKRSLALYKKLNKDKWKFFITSDEAWFQITECNGKTQIQYIPSGQKGHNLEVFERRERHASGFMVWGGISAKGKTRLFFIDPGVKIDSQYYINKILKPFLARDAKKLYPEANFTFHQDSAPSHVSKATTEFMNGKMKYIKKEEWTPKSPDAAPLDYFVWGWMKRRLNRMKTSSMASFKRNLKRVWKELPQEMINNCLKAWPKRMYKIYQAKGGHIEHFK